MEYKELSKLYYMDTNAQRKERVLCEEDARRNSESTFTIDLVTENGTLFIANPRELSILSEKVLRTERRVSSLMRQIPGVSAQAVLRGLVFDEVVSTNAIEDIHSTRRQIQDALGAYGADAQARRFKELALLYLDIMEGKTSIPHTPEDIRRVYDRIMEGELKAGEVPDGVIFRKDGVDVTAGGVKVIHKGLEPESKIIEAVQAMLDLSASESVPALISAIAAHYIFEYAHPFYDGNGRTGRYLLSLFLSEVLAAPTVLSLSRTILENREKYYKAFRSVENPLNHAELTFFVYHLLELVHQAQETMIRRLESGKEAYQEITRSMEDVLREYELSEQEQQAVFFLLQYEVFGLIGDVSVDEVADHLNVKKQMGRKYLKSLEEKGLIQKHRIRNPLTFELTAEFKSKFGVPEAEWRIAQGN